MGWVEGEKAVRMSCWTPWVGVWVGGSEGARYFHDDQKQLLAFIHPPTHPPFPDTGLAKHKDELGAPLCPCRHYEDKQAEAQMAYWNCPCVPMRYVPLPTHPGHSFGTVFEPPGSSHPPTDP